MLHSISTDVAQPHPLGSGLYFVLLLVFTKFLKTFALFLTYDFLKSYHFLLILFLITSVASIGLICVQKSFASSLSVHLKKTIIYRLGKYIAWQTLIHILWLLGLALCGPVRTILLFEHSDLVLRTCFQVLWSSRNESSRQTSRTRGVVFFGIGILTILAFDHDPVRQKMKIGSLSMNALNTCRYWIIIIAIMVMHITDALVLSCIG